MSDPALYARAVKLCPDLWYATQMVERVGGRKVFPITSIDELTNALLADDKKNRAKIKYEGITLTAEEAGKLFPVKYLPIVNESDLLAKLYAAFIGLRELLTLEAKARRSRQSITEEWKKNV